MCLVKIIIPSPFYFFRLNTLYYMNKSLDTNAVKDIYIYIPNLRELLILNIY